MRLTLTDSLLIKKPSFYNQSPVLRISIKESKLPIIGTHYKMLNLNCYVKIICSDGNALWDPLGVKEYIGYVHFAIPFLDFIRDFGEPGLKLLNLIPGFFFRVPLRVNATQIDL